MLNGSPAENEPAAIPMLATTWLAGMFVAELASVFNPAGLEGPHGPTGAYARSQEPERLQLEECSGIALAVLARTFFCASSRELERRPDLCQISYEKK